MGLLHIERIIRCFGYAGIFRVSCIGPTDSMKLFYDSRNAIVVNAFFLPWTAIMAFNLLTSEGMLCIFFVPCLEWLNHRVYLQRRLLNISTRSHIVACFFFLRQNWNQTHESIQLQSSIGRHVKHWIFRLFSLVLPQREWMENKYIEILCLRSSSYWIDFGNFMTRILTISSTQIIANVDI